MSGVEDEGGNDRSERAEDDVAADLAIIVAVARNRVIGRDGDLPWRLKTDLRRFKRLTMGHRLVMGRKTWQSIGRPLPGRTSFVVSRSDLELPDGVVQLGSTEDVVRLAEDGEGTVFCIGGAQLYRAALPLASEAFVTRVDADVVGDVLFPEVDWASWREVERERVPADQNNEYPSTFFHLQRDLDPTAHRNTPRTEM